MRIIDAGMGSYLKTADLLWHSLKAARMVYTIRKKEMMVTPAARKVGKFFNVRNKLHQAAEKKRQSPDEEQFVSNQFSEDLMDWTITLQKSPLWDSASPMQVYNKLKSKIRYFADLKKVSKLFK